MNDVVVPINYDEEPFPRLLSDDQTSFRVSWDRRWYSYIFPSPPVLERMIDWQESFLETFVVIRQEKPYAMMVRPTDGPGYELKERDGEILFTPRLSHIGKPKPLARTRTSVSMTSKGLTVLFPPLLEWKILRRWIPADSTIIASLKSDGFDINDDVGNIVILPRESASS